ncbi:lipase [Xanthomonas hyacinthi]|uniref:Lipase n=1 Tax=Xanthomonas hyacinthi TaxID=56455 RepID=A0A2S7EXK2_9XANT|nr:lipase [Xanthomonas hyacinthi]QGY76593.1 lipase [Xanthomonas hyacinthi]
MSLPRLLPAAAASVESGAPAARAHACAAVSTRHALECAGAVASLVPAPIRRVRAAPRSVKACVAQSSAVRRLHIDAPSADLASAIAQVDGESAQSPGQDPQLELRCRVVLECMRACAGEAYTVDLAAVPDIGRLRFDAPMSTHRLKLWEGSTDDTVVVALGFSGTRLDDANDLLCDVRSQIAQPHVNTFDARLPTLGKVGAGWQEWWQSEARQPRRDGAVMKQVLTRYSELARDSGKALSISLSGHSLGAAAATIAGFDIAHFLRAAGASGKVSVYAFNPPRLGQAGIETLYVDTLRSEKSSLRFTLRQFARALDPVQSTPLFMHHPHWHHDAGADSDRAGSVSGDRFAQFVTCIDSPASSVNPAENHELLPWRDYFLSTIEQAELQRIFAPVQVPPASAEGSRVSRWKPFNPVSAAS